MKENNFTYEGIFFYVVILNFLQRERERERERERGRRGSVCVCVCVCVRNLIFSASQNFHTQVFVLCK
jgi:hypothetical protein